MAHTAKIRGQSQIRVKSESTHRTARQGDQSHEAPRTSTAESIVHFNGRKWVDREHLLGHFSDVFLLGVLTPDRVDMHFVALKRFGLPIHARHAAFEGHGAAGSENDNSC